MKTIDDDAPAFEIVGDKMHIEIYANGRVIGAPFGARIINRIPQYIHRGVVDVRDREIRQMRQQIAAMCAAAEGLSDA